MDQERADYLDYESTARKPPRPWTLTQIAILILIGVLCAPLAFLAVVFGAIALSGGMQH